MRGLEESMQRVFESLMEMCVDLGELEVACVIDGVFESITPEAQKWKS